MAGTVFYYAGLLSLAPIVHEKRLTNESFLELFHLFNKILYFLTACAKVELIKKSGAQQRVSMIE